MESNYTKKTIDEFVKVAKYGDKEAFRKLQEFADAGDLQALRELAEFRLKGLGGVKQIPEKAVELLERAANQNDSFALLRLGDFFRYGKSNVPVDGIKAVEYFTRAAELSNVKSYKPLAEMYIECIYGVPADGYKAIKYLLKHAEQIDAEDHEDDLFETFADIKSSHSNAFKEIANIYLDGIAGVQVDGYKAIKFLSKIKDWSSIADIYRDGLSGVTQDGQKAVEYYTKNEAWSDVAEIYEEGCGSIAPDRSKALQFYEKADAKNDIERLTRFDEEHLRELIKLAEYGDAEVLFELAECFLKGLVVEQVPQETVKLLERAAAQNYAPAYNRLGDFYAHGKCNVSQDGQKAIDCFLKTVELDENENDFASVAKIYRYGLSGIPVDGKKAIEYFTKDYELNGNKESLDEIFYIYKYGCGELRPNAQKVFEFLKIHPDLQIDCFVFDEERGYFKWDGMKIVNFLNQRLTKLEQLNAPDIIIVNELRGIAQVYSAGFGGLTPNREKVIEYYKQIVSLYSNAEDSERITAILKDYKRKIAEFGVETDAIIE